MATAEQLASYHAQCSDIKFSAFDVGRSEEYDPGDEDYYEDVIENHGRVAGAVATLCFVVLVVLLVLSCCLCGITHHWLERMDFVGTVRNGHHWWQRLLGLLFVTAIVVCTILVTAMSVWGIIQVETDVRDVVPKSFDFIDNTHNQLDSIYTNLTSAVANGNEVVPAVREAVQEVREDPSTELLATSDIETNETLFEILTALDAAADDAEDALDTVDTEINENLDDVLDGMRDAVGYRDEGEGINTAGRIVVIIAFCFFVFFAVGSTVFSLCGATPLCMLLWAIIMWLMLVIAFSLVGVLDISREISRETCLYIDTFAVRELREEVNRDPERTEALLWYYFRPPDNRTLSLAELEDLWSFPMTDIVEYLDLAETEIFEGDDLRFPYNLATASTQDALFRVRDLIPQARRDLAYVQDLIEGDTFHVIHADLKDLICCTEYEAVDDVWQAWVVSSVFGLVIAILMTLQALLTLRCGKRPFDGSLTMGRMATQKSSAYMAPPVAEGTVRQPAYIEVTERETSGARLNTNPPSTAATVSYPTVKMPHAPF